MTARRVRPAPAALAIGLAIACLGLIAFAPATALAQESDGYTVEQGGECIDVDSITDESQSVEAFYGYESNETFSSHGTLEYQQDDTSQFLIYEGPEGTSLVFVHDQYHEDQSDGTDGGSATFTFTELPAGSEWAIRDDNSTKEDDNSTRDGSTQTDLWRWEQGRTDGGALNLGDGDFSVGINATFNENRWSGDYHGTIDEWKLVTSPDGDIERTTLETGQPVTVSPGTCGGEAPGAPTADLSAPDSVAVDENVTLDASGSETGSNATYEWIVDGESVATGESPTHETSFSQAGSHDVRVVVTDDGGTDDANATVEVTEGITAAFEQDASTVEAGQEITFNASESTGDIESYEWSFGDTYTASGEEVTHTYAEPGSYDVELTVSGSGGEDSTTRTVEVTPPGPTAALDAPANATAGETVTLDAGASETGPNPTYTWTVDGEEAADASGSTHDVTFSEPGEHYVEVVVSDGGGTDTADATVYVDGGLSASADADTQIAETGEEISFDGSQSTGDVASYEWDFGDGTTATGPTTTHAFDESGSYTVELTVENDAGETASDSIDVTIEDADDGSSGDDGDSDDGSNDDGSGSDDGDGDTGDGSDGTDGDDGNNDDGTGDDGTNGDDGDTGDDSDETDEKDDKNDTDDKDGSKDHKDDSKNDEDGSDDDSNDSDGSSGESGDEGGSGSSGATGGSGGSGGGSSGADEVFSGSDPSVEVDNGTAVITVESVTAGEAVTADLSTNASSDSAVEVERLELVPAESADELTVEFEATEREVPGRFTNTSALVPNASADLESVTYEFAVDRAMANGSGVDAANLTVYAGDDEWSAVETKTERDGDRVNVSATVDGDAPVGVGARGPSLFVSDVRTDGAVTNSTLDVVATVRNTGTDAGERNLTVTAGGEPVDVPVALEPGETDEVSATVPLDDPEDVDVRAGATRDDVLVVTASEVTVQQDAIEPGETVLVEAVLQNHAETAGEHEAELVLADNVAATESVQMSPGEEATVTFEQRVESPGTYQLSVGDASESLSVEDDGAGEQTATEDGAGFGAVAALLAAVLGAAATRRRLRT